MTLTPQPQLGRTYYHGHLASTARKRGVDTPLLIRHLSIPARAVALREHWLRKMVPSTRAATAIAV